MDQPVILGYAGYAGYARYAGYAKPSAVCTLIYSRPFSFLGTMSRPIQ